MLSFATEEIALRTGETLGGLLNATFGYVHCSVNLQYLQGR
jgi:Ca2+/H+ antiporter